MTLSVYLVHNLRGGEGFQQYPKPGVIDHVLSGASSGMRDGNKCSPLYSINVIGFKLLNAVGDIVRERLANSPEMGGQLMQPGQSRDWESVPPFSCAHRFDWIRQTCLLKQALLFMHIYVARSFRIFH
jgi:hypothetical protein